MAEIVQCVRKYVDGISQNLQKLEQLLTVSSHSFFALMDYGQISYISESNNFNQSISMNLFYPIEAFNSIR